MSVDEPERASDAIPFREALRVWVRVALSSFGGPAGQIAVMHRILVEEKKWISETRFLHALNYCMLLPGPEAQQLATYIGWLLHRTIGGLVAGTLFVLPGFVSILILSVLYAGFYHTTVVQGIFFGLKPAIMAIVVEAVIRIGRRALRNDAMVGIAAFAFIAIFFFHVPFPLIVLSAALIGYAGGRWLPGRFSTLRPSSGTQEESPIPATTLPVRPSLIRSTKITMVCLVLWFAPVVGLTLWLGQSHVLIVEGLFFSKMAVVTFGGAYAVLAYVAQEAVNTFGWLRPGEMLDGLGMAETTPGPLIQVVQFVGFMGAYRNPAPFDPLTAGLVGSLLTTWVTFVPCFLWIFLGAPYIEYLRGNRSLNHALTGITAAVVGVILNLAFWFSLYTLFGTVTEAPRWGMTFLIPVWRSIDMAALCLAAGAALALLHYHVGMMYTLAGSAVAGFAYYLIFRV
jgi:chromate transporter